MIDEDSLVATRARRINAGSRLKQLIELEEQASHLQSSISQIITEDDENVNLLFQEDENDEEFFDEEVDNENLIGIDDDDEEEEDEEGEDEEVDEEDRNQERVGKRKRENDDDVLSDSDISASTLPMWRIVFKSLNLLDAGRRACSPNIAAFAFWRSILSSKSIR